MYYPAAVYSLFANGEADAVYVSLSESSNSDADRYFAAAWTHPNDGDFGESVWKGQVINVIVHTMKTTEVSASQF